MKVRGVRAHEEEGAMHAPAKHYWGLGIDPPCFHFLFHIDQQIKVHCTVKNQCNNTSLPGKSLHYRCPFRQIVT